MRAATKNWGESETETKPRAAEFSPSEAWRCSLPPPLVCPSVCLGPLRSSAPPRNYYLPLSHQPCCIGASDRFASSMLRRGAATRKTFTAMALRPTPPHATRSLSERRVKVQSGAGCGAGVTGMHGRLWVAGLLDRKLGSGLYEYNMRDVRTEVIAELSSARPHALGWVMATTKCQPSSSGRRGRGWGPMHLEPS
ncbi:hypothetical protein CC85DRAFT_201984 [Cutaneotrichosporon oleaginosum]|uniref:Uncharacterized protein n=1 Tax=Cutaneotrichosporon oleaginosum TaxID=879819 RepID=A0A0J1B9Z9_9TREE|nr:uncharacterized protein CC85DRAFT_201984 [Cutaneotrichosporon oleaginosum]KLT44694.1 hypothetical protein CC85DRAFT_201984 [Cutaneotrichosporon oleaginosum]TXT07680.1 hypothetical protein COLE_04604 [Cutaneotrichosporon oleaginosum]